MRQQVGLLRSSVLRAFTPAHKALGVVPSTTEFGCDGLHLKYLEYLELETEHSEVQGHLQQGRV